MAFVPNHPLLAALPAMKTAGNTLTLLSFTNFSETVTRVAGEIQTGAAFHEGEQPLAVVEHDVPDKGRGRGYFGALVVTDRRLYGRGNFSTKPDTSFELWLSQILSFTPGGLASGPVVLTPSGPFAVPFLTGPVQKLLEKIVLVPPPYRTMGPTAFAPSPGDEFGARAASHHASGDPRAFALFQLVDGAARAGRLSPEAARALLERVILLDRHAAWGRGMHQGQWLTLLPRPVVRDALASLFGPPAWAATDERSDVLDFGLTSRGSGAALSTALGVASLAVLGVGWISFPGQAPPQVLRFTLGDAPCGSTFTVVAGMNGVVSRLPLSCSNIFAALHRQLVRLEARQLLADAVLSEAPAHARLAAPEHALAESARAVAPALDLRPFA